MICARLYNSHDQGEADRAVVTPPALPSLPCLKFVVMAAGLNDPSMPPIGRSEAKRDAFGLSRYAFLPHDKPLELLDGGYYEAWELIAKELPRLVQKGIRRAISDLPILSTDHLRSEVEWRRAYVVLSYMAQAYVWGGDTPEEVHLAPCLSMPFHRRNY